MKFHIFVTIFLFLTSGEIRANENSKLEEKKQVRIESMKELAKEKNQSPYYEVEFTQDAYYRASRDIASFEFEKSK